MVEPKSLKMHRLNIVVTITVHCGHCQGGHCQHCPPRGCCQHGCPPRGCHQHGCCYHDCHQCSFCHCGCLLEGISFFTSVIVSLSLALSFKAGFHCLFMNYFFTSSRQLYDVPLNVFCLEKIISTPIWKLFMITCIQQINFSF